MSAPYFQTVKTRAAWKREKLEEDDWIGGLQGKSTSSWGRKELAALRVLVSSNELTTLPLLADDSFADLALNLQPDKLADPNTPFWQAFPNERSELDRLIQGPQADDGVYRVVRSDQALRRKYGLGRGAVWSALNRLCTSGKDRYSEPSPGLTYAAEPDSASEDEPPSSPPSSSPRLPDSQTKRSSISRQPARRHVSGAGQEYEAHVRDLRDLIGTSTPPPDPPSSQGYVDNEESIVSTHRPEDMTLKFADVFLSHVLLHLPFQQQENDPYSVEFDVHKMPRKAEIRPGVAFASIDDGGLQLVSDRSACVGRVAVLEAKRSLDAIDGGKPKLSDENFAQMVGEALAVRLRGRDDDGGGWAGIEDRIVVIAVARYFMRFLEVNISDGYLDQLGLPNKHQAADAHYIRVDSTRLFDLREGSHRAHALENIVGIATVPISRI